MGLSDWISEKLGGPTKEQSENEWELESGSKINGSHLEELDNEPLEFNSDSNEDNNTPSSLNQDPL